MQLDKLKAATRVTTFTIDGVGDLEVEYRPTVLAMAARELADLPKDDMRQSMDAMVRCLAATVVWWDLYDENQPVPITVDAIKELPIGTFVSPLLLHLSTDSQRTNRTTNPKSDAL